MEGGVTVTVAVKTNRGDIEKGFEFCKQRHNAPQKPHHSD